jgi:parallel beta-helix repeat protein
MLSIVHLVTICLVVATIPGSAFAADGWTSHDLQVEAPTSSAVLEVGRPSVKSIPVESCRELDTPGRYHLVGNLVSHAYTCLRITANDVVLDGRGHTMTVAQSALELGQRLAMPTPDHFGEAVVVVGSRSNVTVTSLSFEGFDVGVRATGVTGLVITDVAGVDSVTAVYVDGANHALLRAVTVRNSAEDGLVVTNATNVTLDGVTVDSSYFAGIVISDSHRVTIDSTTVRQNHGDGLFVYRSSGVVATELTASENAVGALVIRADGTTVRSSTFDRNRLAGVAIGSTTGVTLTDSTITRTIGDPGVVAIDRTAGLLALAGSDVTLRDVSVVDNDECSVAVADASSVILDRVSGGSTVVSLVLTRACLDLDSPTGGDWRPFVRGAFVRGSFVADA